MGYGFFIICINSVLVSWFRWQPGYIRCEELGPDMDHDRMPAYARDVFTLLFEMRRNPLCVTVMATQNYRRYQLEVGNLIGISE